MKYYLFLDECGDQNLANFNPYFPIFTLCGVLISDQDYQQTGNQVIELKENLWGNKGVILHSRDIRKCEKGFENLFDLEIKKTFYESLNAIMTGNNYTIISCSILKKDYIEKYGRLQDVYALSLSFILERVVFFLDSIQNATVYTAVEKRGKKEDTSLLRYYNKLLGIGTNYVKPDRMKRYFTGFEFFDKKDNIIGLQLSDLVAYPITRYVLDPKAANPAFDLIESKIHSKNGSKYGLKIFP